MKYEVLEEWVAGGVSHLCLVVTPDGEIEGRGCMTGHKDCRICFGHDLPDFNANATTKRKRKASRIR